MSKLKPCPFCGGEAKIKRLGKCWNVSCSYCGVEKTLSTLWCKTTCQVNKVELNLINDWNCRKVIENKSDIEEMVMFIDTIKGQIVGNVEKEWMEEILAKHKDVNNVK